MIPEGFAAEWEAAWNAHDLGRVMSHYDDAVVFRSRKAAALVGTGELRGRDALRAYWSEALSRQPDLRFEVLEVFEGHGMLAIRYRNHRGVMAVETLRFGAGGRVVEASACHSS